MWATSPPPLPLQLRRPPHPRFIARRRNKRLDRIAASQDPLTALTRVLWGGALPPAQLVVAVRHGWTTAWQLLMRQLAPSDPATGGFARAPARFPAVVGKPSSRLHLYVGLPCPWAHRALVVRALLGLEARLPVSVAVPGDDGAWSFTPGSPDLLYGKRKLREVYALRGGGFEGRASVPMLWDAERCEVVCNESIEIVKFLCDLAGDGAGDLDLWPPELRQDIDRWYSIIYPSVNNGVYRARRRTTPRRASCSARSTGWRPTSPAAVTCAGTGSRWRTSASSRRSSDSISSTTRCSGAPGGSWPSTLASMPTRATSTRCPRSPRRATWRPSWQDTSRHSSPSTPAGSSHTRRPPAIGSRS
ncbi:putative glutathione S-transferase family protein isoform X1 [Zea mays]|uniref:GST N-terminal domain-containing protein n=1 Tax=Zea mays TaxID=4577 RepID=C0HIF9_MAIZE|nr:putative glutathione S-transferase family protein isoform X1 [Zea mays]ACN26812.1 unknown [Zea mays]|eukprot:XP_020406941.1 putative glutathione S-transferase family protein isoform X1 [Zea mays]